MFGCQGFPLCIAFRGLHGKGQTEWKKIGRGEGGGGKGWGQEEGREGGGGARGGDKRKEGRRKVGRWQAQNK